LIEDFEKRLRFACSIKKMTPLIHYSESHLHRLFQKHHGKGPLQHLIFLSMECVKYLLTHTNWSIEQIAEQVGYKDVFNFSKRFKNLLVYFQGNIENGRSIFPAAKSLPVNL
jgi:AraC-like DNA-binding protein